MKTLSTYTIWLFDLDGTLTDPKEGITKSVQYACSKFDIPADDPQTLETFIGPPLALSFREQFGFSEQDTKQAIAYYREYFTDRGIFENNVYPGITELLTSLTSQRKRIMVATSKPHSFAQRILKHFDLEQYFEHIHGSELDGTRSDKAELIAYMIRQYNIDPLQTVMVGDRKHDMIGAVRNQVLGIGAGYGYGNEKELMDAGASYYAPTVDSLRELCDFSSDSRFIS
ncbi:HAD family hydrolase [Paenibacillus nasutitermitis]|uniref:Phosphoglycolate phosphatase n=1 Tax=Paenibacillus nasutitermitis TaxID=1652958 RepID=A0A917DQ26_9BACL|nr:HAD family hydrolase [Paenibacillus nasutitermitis]GGD55871.1 phosphoglycolate phosphatase [Paenibacillus nasutitermitis]